MWRWPSHTIESIWDGCCYCGHTWKIQSDTISTVKDKLETETGNCQTFGVLNTVEKTEAEYVFILGSINSAASIVLNRNAFMKDV